MRSCLVCLLINSTFFVEIVAEEKVEYLLKQFEANILNVQQEVKDLQQQVSFERKEREALEGKVDTLIDTAEKGGKYFVTIIM